MKLKCSRCGKDVSTEVPDETIIRAWIECPECINGMSKAIARTEDRKKIPGYR